MEDITFQHGMSAWVNAATADDSMKLAKARNDGVVHKLVAELKIILFTFDGARCLATSKLWIKIQRSHIGKDIGNVTAFVVSEKK